ncbi:MAG: DegT/DnrJ/EryC1/StrS family aminotransferase, partial [Planctomycetia bacterium]|nr:DegT/DnrJ/EryC1/StrS family aminotransferase [Planctomycetia bacterium]
GNNAFPLSELQAAVLLPQLEQLDGRNVIRRDNAEFVRQQLRALNGLIPIDNIPPQSSASLFKLAWLFNESAWIVERDKFLAAMRAEGIAIDAGFRGFTKRGASRCRRAGELTNSTRAAAGTVLLHHPVLLKSQSTVERVVEAFQKVHRAFSVPKVG